MRAGRGRTSHFTTAAPTISTAKLAIQRSQRVAHAATIVRRPRAVSKRNVLGAGPPRPDSGRPTLLLPHRLELAPRRRAAAAAQLPHRVAQRERRVAHLALQRAVGVEVVVARRVRAEVAEIAVEPQAWHGRTP